MEYFTEHQKRVFYAFGRDYYICVELFNTDTSINVVQDEYSTSLRLSRCIENGEESTKEEFDAAFNKALGIINSIY